jgi:hypothetical protein
MAADPIRITTEELGSRGILTGDSTPSNLKGLFPRKRKFDDDNKTALEAQWSEFHATTGHDHSAAGAQLGSQKADGTRHRSFQSDAITNAKIGAGQVTGGKTKDGAITNPKVTDDSVERSKFGPPREVFLDVPQGSTATWNHGLGYRPLFHFERGNVGSHNAMAWISVVGSTTSAVTFRCVTGAPVTVPRIRIVYYGG